MVMNHGATPRDNGAPGAGNNRPSRLLSLTHGPDEVARRTQAIYDNVLRRSRWIRTGNFERIAVRDLEFLFHLYNRDFFAGLISEMLDADRSPVSFRLSRRLTRTAGKTTRLSDARPPGQAPREPNRYEIAVSSVLLFGTFQDVSRPVTVGGLICVDRLQALQRIFEHELLHLVEFLGWDDSDCKKANFQRLSQRIFGHEGVHHDLVTPHEVASVTQDIRVGDMASFVHEGNRLVGLVNRITRRATVLVEHPSGQEYQSGKRFLTYYVPLGLLRKENPGGAGPR
jgi:hypothetical protein